MYTAAKKLLITLVVFGVVFGIAFGVSGIQVFAYGVNTYGANVYGADSSSNAGGGSGYAGGGGSSGLANPTPSPTPTATTTVPSLGCLPGFLFDIFSGKRCSANAATSTPATLPTLPQPLPTPAIPTNLPVPPASAFTRDTQVGSSHSEVKSLQQYLNAKGYFVSVNGSGSPGKETTYFGGLTQKALAKFQKDHGITPAAGYFGPKTRAYIKANP